MCNKNLDVSCSNYVMAKYQLNMQNGILSRLKRGRNQSIRERKLRATLGLCLQNFQTKKTNYKTVRKKTVLIIICILKWLFSNSRPWQCIAT